MKENLVEAVSLFRTNASINKSLQGLNS